MTMDETDPIYILGGGPAGLAAAYTLTKLDQSVVVVERDSKVGGFAQNIEYRGFILNFDPQRCFTKVTPVLNLCDEALGDEPVTVHQAIKDNDKELSLLRAVCNALSGSDRKVKTRSDRVQPRYGSGQLYEKIAGYLRSYNQPVLLNTEVVQVHHDNFQVTQLTLRNRLTGEESTVNCGGVISSIPMSLLTQQITSSEPQQLTTAAKPLKFSNTILVYLTVESSQSFPDNWLYINEPNVRLGRVTSLGNGTTDRLANPYQTTLCCEYWCNFDEPMWQQPEVELLIQARQDLRKTGLLHDENVSKEFVVRLPNLINYSKLNATTARLISVACVSFLSFTGPELHSFAWPIKAS